MQLDEEQYSELIDRVVDEGEPDLIVGPIKKAPPDLPALWAQALTAPDPAAVIAQLWKPMESRLPRVCQAIRERLRGIGLLRTEERDASLVYFFADGESVFAFRGYPALSTDTLETSSLPADFLDFYQIHNGWVNFHSEDGGPLPMADWLPLSEVWEDIALKLPPGDGSAETFVTVFRDGPELALVYDTSSSPVLPMRCWNDGSVDVLLDIWMSIDREVGEFLEELGSRSGADRSAVGSSAERHANATQEHEQLLARAAERQALAAHFGGGGVYEQICDLSLDRARLEKRAGGEREQVVKYYRQALANFCTSVDLGGDVSPEEVLDWFGIAHALDDAATAHFVATLPTSIWADDSLAALHARTLFCLYLGDVDHAKEFIDEILGLTFGEAEDEVDLEADITARMLHALTAMDAAAFSQARQRAIDELTKGRAQQQALLPWNLRLRGFDAVAVRYGLMRRSSKR